MSLIEFSNITKSYGDQTILDGLDLRIESGDLTVLYGPPGSGKSVLLRMLVGLESPDDGEISVRGVDAEGLKPGDRNIGYVPQSFALFPNKSVRANIAYPLTVTGGRRAERHPDVERVAELLGIAEFLDRTPDLLSGGQKQRVAIARGLVRDTEIYVLDDPLVGLDFKLRERLVDDLRRTRDALGATFVYATSDSGEALTLGSKIAVLVGGAVVEHGDPFTLYEEPRHLHTMTGLCFPASNVLQGELLQREAGQVFETSIGDFPVMTTGEVSGSEPVVGVVRAEHVELQQGAGAFVSGEATVALREDFGAEEVVYLDGPNGASLISVLRADASHATDIELGEHVSFSIDPARLVLFEGERRIGRGCLETESPDTGIGVN